MSVLDDVTSGHEVPVVSVQEKILDLETRLETQTTIANNLRIRTTQLDHQIESVRGYLIDCLDMGDSPDAESIADYLGIELKRDFSVRVEVVFDFIVSAATEDAAQEMVDDFNFSASGDFTEDYYEVTDTTVLEA
jgi:hypothetical protein